MLQAKKISYSYSHNTALLEEVDCTVKPGVIVGLPGLSGCGKSTLGRLLSGYTLPEPGAILCEGQPLPDIGYCPVQMIFQHPELAVNPRWKIGKILVEGNCNYRELLHPFGIYQNWLERYPHELSGGELQRIALIRAMSSSTRYLIADETPHSTPALRPLSGKQL